MAVHSKTADAPEFHRSWLMRIFLAAIVGITVIWASLHIQSTVFVSVADVDITEANVIAGLIAIGLWLALPISAEARPSVFTNRSLGTRVAYISELIRSSRRSLLIVADDFNHNVYDHPNVLAALRAVPESVGIEFATTEERVDNDSKGFKHLVKAKGWLIYHAPGARNVIISDTTHVRIERKHEKHSNIRKAVYEYGAPGLAARLLRDARGCIEFDKIIFGENDDIAVEQPSDAAR